MTSETRPATPEDADFLLRVINLASEGVLPMVWAYLRERRVTTAGLALRPTTRTALSWPDGRTI
jgi:hypothetical protein